MIVYGLDPGTTASALVVYDSLTARVEAHLTDENDAILECLVKPNPRFVSPVLVVEQIESMGMAVGRETFETVWYSGRFHQAWAGMADRVTRRAVKLHLCGSMRAKDTNIRQAILDRFGGKALAIGYKKAPGVLYGIHSHEYAALAVAITWAETHNPSPSERATTCRPTTLPATP